MDLLLDMKTIFITLVVGHLFTLILISSYWRLHKKDTTLTVFFLAKIFQAIAWLFLTLRNGIPDIFTISLANSLLFIGSSLEAMAILKLLKKDKQWTKKIYVFFTILIIISFHLIMTLFNTENNRIAFASIGTVLLIIIPTYSLLWQKSSTLVQKIMGCLYLLVIISLSSRGVVALFSDFTLGLFTPSVMQSFSFLTLYLIMILGNTGFILMLKEQTDEELIYMARYDELTNAFNRRTFISQAEKYLTQCKKEKIPLTYVLFDIDNFKKFNDKYGHDIGDRILRDLTDRIHEIIGTEHILGRYGGDEFAIFLKGICKEDAVQLLEKIRKKIEEGSTTEIPSYTISIGAVTIIPDEKTKIDALYISSDKALYQAKDNGRNCIYCVNMKD